LGKLRDIFVAYVGFKVASQNTKFVTLGLEKKNRRKNHVQEIIPKLTSYLARRMYPCCKTSTLKMIYFAYFHVVMEYGIFWGEIEESKNFPSTKKNN
jgi:hypothetical protein